MLGLVLDCIGDCNVSQELSYGDDENLLRGKQKATGKIVCVCNLPFPLDHFFFCFFAPELAAGAMFADLERGCRVCRCVVLRAKFGWR